MGKRTRRRKTISAEQLRTIAANAKPGKRVEKLAAKQAADDATYRKALGMTTDAQLPKTLGKATGHGGAQPQVGERRRATRVIRRTPR